jgi:hypothetical protein
MAKYVRDDYKHHMIAVSIEAPKTDLLKQIANNDPTRVIHFADWQNNVADLFNTWMAHAICEGVASTTTKTTTTSTTTVASDTTTKMAFASEAPTGLWIFL